MDFLSFLRNLEGVYPIGQVGCELLVQLPQALLQNLKHVISFPQDLELLFQRNLFALCQVTQFFIPTVESLQFLTDYIIEDPPINQGLAELPNLGAIICWMSQNRF